MQTSLKRTKLHSNDKFLGAILGICLVLAGCSKTEQVSEIVEEPDSEVEKTTEIEVVDYSGFYDRKVSVSGTADAYREIDGTFVRVGSFQQDALIDLGHEQCGNLVQISGEDFYIDGAMVQECDRWFANRNNLIPYQTAIVTSDQYTIEDQRGTVYLNGDCKQEYQVYVKPCDSDPRYGILFQNAVYYIPADEVAEEVPLMRDPSACADDMAVLMYHFFYDDSLGESRKDGNYVEVNELDEQLSYLENNGFSTLTMREVEYFMEGRAQIPEKSVAITIDDGDPSVHDRAYDVFMKHHTNATMFLICGWEEPTMSYERWEMRENGFELQSHGFLTHQGGCSGMGHGGRLMCMAYEEGIDDTQMSFDYCDGGFVYCYPFGDVNDNGKKIIADAGAKLAFTTVNGRINPSMDRLELPRIRVTGGNSISTFAASIE